MVIFHSYVTVYQRVPSSNTWSLVAGNWEYHLSDDDGWFVPQWSDYSHVSIHFNPWILGTWPVMTIMSPTLDDELLILWRKNSNLGFVSDYFGVRSLCKSSGDKGQPQRNHCTWVWLKNGYQWTHKSYLVQCLTISNDGAVKKNCWAIPSEAQPLAPPSEGLLVQIPAAGPRPVAAQDYRPQNLFSQTDQNRIPLLQVDYPILSL